MSFWCPLSQKPAPQKTKERRRHDIHPARPGLAKSFGPATTYGYSVYIYIYMCVYIYICVCMYVCVCIYVYALWFCVGCGVNYFLTFSESLSSPHQVLTSTVVRMFPGTKDSFHAKVSVLVPCPQRALHLPRCQDAHSFNASDCCNCSHWGAAPLPAWSQADKFAWRSGGSSELAGLRCARKTLDVLRPSS